jgi:hypothetical protein
VARWEKLLGQIVTDPKPVSYTYDELATLLVSHLGFTLFSGGGSHRRFWRKIPSPDDPSKGTTITIGLVDSGRGKQRPEYVREMVRTLRANSLLPKGVE